MQHYLVNDVILSIGLKHIFWLVAYVCVFVRHACIRRVVITLCETETLMTSKCSLVSELLTASDFSALVPYFQLFLNCSESISRKIDNSSCRLL